jgi:hypothetical protein
VRRVKGNPQEPAGSLEAGSSRQCLVFGLAVLVVAVGALAFVGSASATLVHPLKEVFGSAVQPGFGTAEGLAIDQSDGDLLVIDAEAGTVSRFSADGTPANFSVLGSNVIDGRTGADQTPQEGLAFGAAPEVQVAVDNSGAATEGDIYVTQLSSSLVDIFAPTGAYLGQLTESSEGPFAEICGVAVGPTGNVYVGNYSAGRVDKFVPSTNPPLNSDNTANFPIGSPCSVAAGVGPTAGAVFAAEFVGPVSKLDSTTGTLEYLVAESPDTTVAVDSGSGHVDVATGSEIIEYDVSGAAGATRLSTLTVGSNVQGLAVDAATGDVYLSRAGSSAIEVFGPPTTIPNVSTNPATDSSRTTATLNGAVFPDGRAVTECSFKWGTTTSYGRIAPCQGAIPTDEAEHPVTAALSGLTGNTTYHFRLVAGNSAGTVQGEDREFSTTGPPQVSEEIAAVAPTAATLGAKIDPSGLETTYYFEAGPGTSYGKRIPADSNLSAGVGFSPVGVSTALSGLTAGTTYHFRLVATNAAGTTVGPDRQLHTPSSAGLPDDRQIELVSPADKRPTGSAEKIPGANVQNYFQAAERGDAVAYPILNALERSQSGGETIFLGLRSAAGWASTEITPPASIPSPEAGLLAAGSGRVLYDSEDLDCAVVSSFNPLTADTSSVDMENGVTNLYRWDRASNTYSLLTNRVPQNLTARPSGNPYYTVSGASSDCSRVFFRSTVYSFISGSSGLYESRDGSLHDAELLPDGSVPTGLPDRSATTGKNMVSADGRFFFVATSDEGEDSGHAAVFVRKSPTETVDVSQSTTATPSLDARYETASPDGSSAFFLANYGLASPSSKGPAEGCSYVGSDLLNVTACDLYRHDVDGGQTIDISADPNPDDPKGAVVQGVLASSQDGGTVYFAARGQLVPGRGRSYEQNLAGEGFANVYQWSGGRLSYVGSLTGSNVGVGNENGALITENEGWTSQTTKSGAYLLFVSSDNINGANPAGVKQAYLYTAFSETLECVSCTVDGSPSIRAGFNQIAKVNGLPQNNVLQRAKGISKYVPRSLSEDGRVFFTVEDALTPAAVAGEGEVAKGGPQNTENNVYEWDEGQITLLATGQVEMIDSGGPDARDVFIRSYAQLGPQDFDFASDLYDLRSGGGLAAPTTPPVPCDPIAGGCQGTPATPPGAPGSATSDLAGPGNPTHPKRKHRKHKGTKKHGKHEGHEDKKAHDKHRGEKGHHQKHRGQGRGVRAVTVDRGGPK